MLKFKDTKLKNNGYTCVLQNNINTINDYTNRMTYIMNIHNNKIYKYRCPKPQKAIHIVVIFVSVQRITNIYLKIKC